MKAAFWRERREGRCEAPRSLGMRPAGPLALLLAPYMQPGILAARASAAGLWASSKM